MSPLRGIGRTLYTLMVTMAVVLALPARAAEAQDTFDPLPEGLRFTAQAGLAFSTLTGVEPKGTESYSRHRSMLYSLRMSQNLGGPLVGFLEAGTAERGSRISVPSQPEAEYRTRWWEVAGGVSVVGRCFAYVCPALDGAIGLSRNRQSLLYNQATGRPLGTLGIARYETAAVVGVRLAIPQWQGLALVVRHHEGLTNLPTDESKARSRSQQLMLSLPLTR